MNSRFPEAGTIRTALSSGVARPVGAHTQPWRWHVGAASLELFADPARQRTNIDPGTGWPR